MQINRTRILIGLAVLVTTTIQWRFGLMRLVGEVQLPPHFGPGIKQSTGRRYVGLSVAPGSAHYALLPAVCAAWRFGLKVQPLVFVADSNPSLLVKAACGIAHRVECSGLPLLTCSQLARLLAPYHPGLYNTSVVFLSDADMVTLNVDRLGASFVDPDTVVSFNGLCCNPRMQLLGKVFQERPMHSLIGTVQAWKRVLAPALQYGTVHEIRTFIQATGLQLPVMNPKRGSAFWNIDQRILSYLLHVSNITVKPHMPVSGVWRIDRSRWPKSVDDVNVLFATDMHLPHTITVRLCEQVSMLLNRRFPAHHALSSSLNAWVQSCRQLYSDIELQRQPSSNVE